MNANVLEAISYVAFACSFLFILMSVVLFVKLDIKSIIDDLSGKKAERHIQALREQNANQRRNINIISGRTDNAKSGAMSTDERTTKLGIEEDSEESELTVQLYNETVLLTENETMLLEESAERDIGCKLILNEIIVHTGERI